MFDVIARYSHPTQPFFIVAFVAWWLLGSAWLLQRAIRRRTELRRQALGPCVLGVFLAGLGAVVVAGLVFQLISRLGESPDSGARMGVLAAIPAVLAAVPMALLVLFAVFQFPLRRLLRVSWLPLASVALAAVVLGLPAFLLGWSQRVNKGKAGTSVEHLRQIDEAIRAYELKFDKQPPRDLWTLSKEIVRGPGRSRATPATTADAKDANRQVTFLNADALECPFLPGVAVGYFYLPVASVDRGDRNCRTLRACEWTHSHSDQYRAMLFANGDAYWAPDGEFRSKLSLPENADFARLFQAADANRR